jgi:hypothetical protein
MHGRTAVSFRIPVRDARSGRVHIRAWSAPVSAAARQWSLPGGASVHVTPASFTLRPGHRRYVRVRITGVGGQHVHVADVVFSATVAGHGSGSRVTAAAASKITLSGSGTINATVPYHAASSAADVPLIAGGTGFAVLAAVAVAGLVIRARRRPVDPATMYGAIVVPGARHRRGGRGQHGTPV